MNENIDLTKILKDCPIGWEFYSSIYGNVIFLRIDEKSDCPIVLFFIDKNKVDRCVSVTEQGLDSPLYDGECTLFPSKEQRDWSKFTAPWYKKERDTISLLEKQGEQKSADKIEPKFHKGQWIACNGLNTALIIDIVDDKYEVEFFDGNKGFTYIGYVDRLFHLWTIQDAKDGDVLAAHECYVVFKEIDGLNIKCYCTYHYLGFKPGLYRDTVQNKNAFLPATKEQHDAMMKAMNDAGYEWNAKTKTLRNKNEKL